MKKKHKNLIILKKKIEKNLNFFFEIFFSKFFTPCSIQPSHLARAKKTGKIKFLCFFSKKSIITCFLTYIPVSLTNNTRQLPNSASKCVMSPKYRFSNK